MHTAGDVLLLPFPWRAHVQHHGGLGSGELLGERDRGDAFGAPEQVRTRLQGLHTAVTSRMKSALLIGCDA
jgi:hypothetical protein